MSSLYIKDYVIGANSLINTLHGVVPRIYFNNSATTLVLKPVFERFRELLEIYTCINVSNKNSDIITCMYEGVREIVLQLIGGDESKDEVIYVKNATAGINLLSDFLFRQDSNQVVLSTKMEHLANYLPYKVKLRTELIELTPDGNIDMCDYEKKLEKYKEKVKLVAVTGASNITGVIPPYYEMAKLAHKYGAKIFVDIVQSVQHRPFSMKPHSSNEHIDFVAFSAHKCYTGIDGGVLVGPSSFLKKCKPVDFGSGITKFVSEKKLIVTSTPQRFENGYEDVLGIVIMGNALEFLMGIGLENIVDYECRLYKYLLGRLKEIPNIIIYAKDNKNVGIPNISFNIKGMNYKDIAYQLGYEYGIEIGSGQLGADMYVQYLLGLTEDEVFKLYCNGTGYGVVRVSLGIYNTCEEIDRFICCLKEIAVEVC